MRQDWNLIKQEYITNPITQEKLAVKYKVSMDLAGALKDII